MKSTVNVLRRDETAVMSLRSLYERYGYKKYKMSKFEEYDLYLHNKSFLTSEKIVTFTDPRGKLLALKPDITLSIIKNAPRDISGAYKAYYCENVYRAGESADDLDIKEIMQVGIELIGNVDIYCECEVLMLAEKSLREISSECIIGISHMGLISALLSEAGLDGEAAERAVKALADKNLSALYALCGENDVAKRKLGTLSNIYGDIGNSISKLRSICSSAECEKYICELEEISCMLSAVDIAKSFVLDFSVSNDMNYYNGITFQSFIDGIPRHVLSGGRYDTLVNKMGNNSEAIGFAVYPDILEMFMPEEKEADVDILFLYSEECDALEVSAAAETLRAEGKTVCVLRDNSNTLPTYRELVRFEGAKL